MNRKTGEVVMDEKNSIMLNGKFFKNKMVFLFELDNVKILTEYTLHKNSITMEHFTFPQRTIESGGAIQGTDTILKAMSVPVLSRQEAMLKKV
ncbi:MAG: hypothetical protein N3F09_03370 [Bacteroidia bacterium]|nr:hypothetical protein [Bacteroidia bacterium]